MSKSRKKRKRSKQKRWGKVLLISAMVGVFGLAVLFFVGYLVLQNYLHSDSFRVLVGNETSKALEAALAKLSDPGRDKLADEDTRPPTGSD